ncbi:MAG TPA: hypothetical protein VJ772_09335 [Nitrososphaeraceae archaeon]|nr:hypothetical protein [Nitrososphaeraceae archaeon]
MKIQYLLVSVLIFISLSTFISHYVAYAHLAHTPHYNGGSNRDGIGKYYPYMALDPEYAAPDEPTQITFSVQDFDGNDVYDIETMVEIYQESTGERVKGFPWTVREIGDFNLYYVFPNPGGYEIVLSVANDDKMVNHNQLDASRSILSSIADCNCQRVIFNVSISESWGLVRNSLLVISILIPIIVLGLVLGKMYLNRRNEQSISGMVPEKETLKYIIMLLAIAGGLVHLAIFPEHGSQHIYYSVFLMAAAGAQVAYGILYILINFTGESYSGSNRNFIINQYRKRVALNLFGFIGTAVLIGLYAFSVIVAPPLSPDNKAENIDIAGIMAKAVEILLVIGIIYLIKWEKKRVEKILISPK